VFSVLNLIEETCTLLILREKLRPHLDDIDFFYEVHEEAVPANWQEGESWLCIVRYSFFRSFTCSNELTRFYSYINYFLAFYLKCSTNYEIPSLLVRRNYY
jgi:hypothetical protein